MPISTLAAGTVAGIRGAVSTLVVILFALMMAAVLIQIAGRYVFNYSISGAEEIATFSQIWLVFFGAGVAMRRGQHVVVDVLSLFLPLRIRQVIAVLVAAGSVLFVAIVAKTSLALVNFGFIQSSAALQLPMWIIYLCMPVGSLYLIFEIIAATFDAPQANDRQGDATEMDP